MSIPQPVILLIPGAWHQAECWESVSTLLQDQKYPVVSVTLPSAGGPTSSTIADDAAYIRSKYLDVLVDQGHEVIIVMHSYGGIPGTESVKGRARKDVVAQGKSGGVIALVYVTAFLIPAGQSLSETLPSDSPSLGDATQPNDPRFHFYNDLDDETAAKCMDALVHHSLPSFVTPLTYEAYRDVPVSYLLCERDEAILPAFQKQMAAFPGNGAVRTYTCMSGHSPMISMPEKVVDVIQDTAAVVKA
ncbi:hypothetical protein N7450_009975 [Penicillium hetheringtonii]|uniref:AB hydrolase-1 domain-containing protein n=1 Tax=Penicillium hetheringtonii TaxID=911720 RepID=A0AAD6GPA5_9EURO|nr:hypothetical protein N7450_009975 [Penicillium hetheringtonii]